jgi:hypothetical protein
LPFSPTRSKLLNLAMHPVWGFARSVWSRRQGIKDAGMDRSGMTATYYGANKKRMKV